jgi:1-acyl-sn-glycerol-3-phosphate acyltransferase
MKLIQLVISRLEVYGRENIPAEGPYLVVVNHVSSADTAILFVAFPVMRWRFFAGEKWRSHRLWGPLMGWLGAIYINRGAIDRGALREALAALAAGDVFGLAPEGTRSKVGATQEAKDGAAYLASQARVPILPVGLVNSDILFANVRRLRRTMLEVHIGRPFLLPELGRRARSRDLTAYTHLIMAHIAALLPERYHGYYGDSPAVKALLAGDDPWPHCLAAARVEMEP